MKTQKITPLTFLIILSMIVLPACSGTSALAKQGSNTLAPVSVQAAAPVASPTQAAPIAVQPGLLSSYEGTLENIYTQVNPSVVNIQVVDQQSAPSLNSPFFGFPGQQQNTPQYSQALGSGFVWDQQGHIITNNHVIDGATSIQVSFSDGTTVPATVVGTDVNSDLAVIKVDVSSSLLHPVQMADSSQIKVGQLAIAIGSPFGNQGTMTVGIISAIGRSLPVNQATTQQGASYTIPDVIQTDAPINPGNSGGVLLNDLGQVVGVTAAIESPTQANAGIGYAIPSEIVLKVIPALISTGHYDHPYLGISGTTLTPDLAKAMNLSSDQRGALIEQVVPNGPADKAGIQGSDQQVTINGLNIPVGGDIITAIDGQPIKTIDDLIAYLNDHTEVGQKATFTILRNGKEMSLDVTLEARPTQNNITSTSPTSNNQVMLGIVGLPVDSQIAQSMGLSINQQGILIERVEVNSPADQAGLQGSTQPATIQGQEILVGGDIILKIDNQPVNQVPDLTNVLQQYQPGDQVQLTILRNGAQMQLKVTLAAQ